MGVVRKSVIRANDEKNFGGLPSSKYDMCRPNAILHMMSVFSVQVLSLREICDNYAYAVSTPTWQIWNLKLLAQHNIFTQQPKRQWKLFWPTTYFFLQLAYCFHKTLKQRKAIQWPTLEKCCTYKMLIYHSTNLSWTDRISRNSPTNLKFTKRN